MSAGRVPAAAETAVVLVECQQGVLGEGSVLPDLRDASPGLPDAVARLADVARAAGAVVVHATYEGSYGAVDHGTAPLWRLLGPTTRAWAPGSHSTEILPGLRHPDDLVIPRHHGLCPGSGTELFPVLRGLGRRSVVLAGVSLNVALPLAAGEAVHNGFRVLVPRDAVAGTPAAYGEQVLRNTMSMLATVTSVAELAQAWGCLAETSDKTGDDSHSAVTRGVEP
ncbi:isochorismatase family protein [Pseudonocardia parietis]|uniref:Nicotinamidase-related amidase n=1 Tax=Pseudonocardia parietis TaxID=570936 RepID=A0ABS4W0N2_9PSEU|nr:isochorismatase family protein [Pseudonocardia parietis]MBP2369764.1 nicotinamidase-related amidase [Pseudonocardia parietis]